MNMAKVIGTIWATVKNPNLEGAKMQIIQPYDMEFNKMGGPIVAVDTVGAGQGEFVYYVTSREAALPLKKPLLTPADASIVGIVDRVDHV
ncbi:EutN/CcmL family microcompartment protein [bacterium]|nr:EutN/CcmL family microcompartment protein [bacterium]